jgi:hypothetical protein
MRIAVSGTHAAGKSVLIDAFLGRHADFAHEPEPYLTLQEAYGESFADIPTVEDFQRQLEFNAETLRRYSAADRVIFERSPFDFLAYIVAAAEQMPSGASFNDLEETLSLVRSAARRLDVIVFLPLDATRAIEVSDDENPRLRNAVDELLQRILLADEFNVFAQARPVIVEARGTVEQRLLALESTLLA